MRYPTVARVLLFLGILVALMPSSQADDPCAGFTWMWDKSHVDDQYSRGLSNRVRPEDLGGWIADGSSVQAKDFLPPL